MLMEMIGIILVLLFLGMFDSGGSVTDFIDFPTLISMLVLTVPVLLRQGWAKDFFRAFKLLNRKYSCSFSELRYTLDIVEMMQKQVICAGCIVTLQGIFMTLKLVSDFAALGPNIIVALLPVFYAAIFEMLLLPLQIEAKRRIVNYMEKEDDEKE